MAHFLFVDESGSDTGPSPYAVLGGIAIEDWNLWNLVRELQECELRQFGVAYRASGEEIKAKKFLNAKTFRKARHAPPLATEERVHLSRECLRNGAEAGRGISALAQSKLLYVEEALEICSRYRCKVFASIVEKSAPKPAENYLRKDYAYLFERFFYYLDDLRPESIGIVVFDELEKTQSHLLVGQMDRYFKETATGRHRSSLLIPEPFFVHSDLTTGIQLADLICYVISWGFRLPSMTLPARAELSPFANQIAQLRNRSVRDVDGNPSFQIWSFAYIQDLRTQGERAEGGPEIEKRQ